MREQRGSFEIDKKASFEDFRLEHKVLVIGGNEQVIEDSNWQL